MENEKEEEEEENRVSDNWQGIFFPRVPSTLPSTLPLPLHKGKRNISPRAHFPPLRLKIMHIRGVGRVGKHGDIYFIRSIYRERADTQVLRKEKKKKEGRGSQLWMPVYTIFFVFFFFLNETDRFVRSISKTLTKNRGCLTF